MIEEEKEGDMSVTRRKLYERDAAQRRANTERVIRRRMNIMRNVWGQDMFFFNRDTGDEVCFEDQPHRLSKWNLTCDCPLHKRSHDEQRRMYQKRQQARIENEFDDWTSFEDDASLCESLYNEVMYGDPEWEREIHLLD